MRTIALKEKTFGLLRNMKEKEKSDSFDELVLDLIMNKEGVSDSMFGSLKGKTKRFTSKERNRIWKDEYRK